MVPPGGGVIRLTWPSAVTGANSAIGNFGSPEDTQRPQGGMAGGSHGTGSAARGQSVCFHSQLGECGVSYNRNLGTLPLDSCGVPEFTGQFARSQDRSMGWAMKMFPFLPVAGALYTATRHTRQTLRSPYGAMGAATLNCCGPRQTVACGIIGGTRSQSAHRPNLPSLNCSQCNTTSMQYPHIPRMNVKCQIPPLKH